MIGQVICNMGVYGETRYEIPGFEVLHVEHLSISFGGLKAVNDISLSIKMNEIYGLIGPNGAGKTTMFNCITQFYKPDSGKVLFRTNSGDVEDLVGQKVHSIIQKGLVRTFQNVELINELSLIDNVLVGAHIDFQSSGFAQAFRLPKARREEELKRKEAERALEFIGILHLKDETVAGQPYGVRKKVELARALMCRPKLIILDEPAAGLNDVETQQLAETIKKIRDAYNCTIMLVEHDMRLVMGVCDRICAISFGKFIACGTPAEIQLDPAVQAAYLGEQEKREAE